MQRLYITHGSILTIIDGNGMSLDHNYGGIYMLYMTVLFNIP